MSEWTHVGATEAGIALDVSAPHGGLLIPLQDLLVNPDREGPLTVHYTVDQIAQVCHEANRALRLVNMEDPSPAWAGCSQELRDSVIEGVSHAQAGATPAELHESWADFTRAHGWTYGETQDDQAKTHPCLVPYDDLPAGQRAKDHVFHAIIAALT